MFYPLGKQDFKFGFVMLGWFNTRLWIFLTFPSQSTVVAKQQQEWCVQRPPWPNNKDASGITLRDARYNAQHCCVHQSNGAYKQSIFCGPGLKSQITSLCLCTCLSESTPRWFDAQPAEPIHIKLGVRLLGTWGQIYKKSDWTMLIPF